MITVYTGIDLVDTTRLDGLQPGIRNRFIKRVFTPLEIEEAGNSSTSLSGKFAVKEAVAKALGCGIGAIGWQSIEVLTSPAGAPFVKLNKFGRIDCKVERYFYLVCQHHL